MRLPVDLQRALGGEALAGFYSIIMTCELHGINPHDFIADVLDRLAAGHPNSEIDELMPWNWKKKETPHQPFPEGVSEVDQDYPPEQLIRDLGLEGEVYYEPPPKLGS